jgi:hypothetical protein
MKRRFENLRRKILLGLAGLVGGFATACAPNPPGEAPPLAPRPEPVQPMPGGDEPVVPGAPDPMSPKFPPDDAGAPGAPPPRTAPGFADDRIPVQTPDAGRAQAVDAGVNDAVNLPPVPDAAIPDAVSPATDSGARR